MDAIFASISQVVQFALQATGINSAADMDPMDQDIMKGYANINTTMADLESNIVDLRSVLAAKVPADATAINTALDLALASLYKMAIFVRGDYDHKSVDALQKKQLVDTVMSTFQAVKAQSEDAFKHLSEIHAEEEGLRSDILVNLKDKLVVLGKQTTARLSGLQTNIDDANRTISQLAESYRQAEDNINTLRDKKRSAENAALASNVGLGILTFGIWSIVGAVDHSKSPSAVIGLQNAINDAQQSIDSIQSSLVQARGRILTFQTQLTSMHQAQTSDQSLSQKIPNVETEIDHNLNVIDSMTKALVQMKDIGAALLERMSLLANAAELTADSFSKKEFVAAVLDACLIGCVDNARANEVRTVLNEVVTGYDNKPLPQELQKQVDAVNQKLNDLPKTSTVEDALDAAVKGV